MNKKIVLVLSISIVVFLFLLVPFAIFLIDLNNVEELNVLGFIKINLNTITRDYDWLSYLGAITTGIGTITLGIITLLQNNRLNEINKRLENEKIISENVSYIDFDPEQYMYIREDSAGFKLFEKDAKNLNKQKKLNVGEVKTIGSKKHNNVRFLINIKEQRDKIINYFKIEKLKIEYKVKEELDTSREFFMDNSSDYYAIERKEDNLYYLTFMLYGLNETISLIENSERIRLTFTFKIKNYIDVETTIWSEIVLDKSKKDIDGDKMIYDLFKKRMIVSDVKRVEQNKEKKTEE